MSGFPVVKLESVVSFKGGGTPSKAVPEYYTGDIPWVTPKDMKFWSIVDSRDKITKEAVDNSSAKLIPSNSVLVVIRSGVLKHTLPVGINHVPVAINQDMKALLCVPGVEPAYIARFLKYASPRLLAFVRATTADNLPFDRLKKLQVPLPPLEEQRRIVEILDLADETRRNQQEIIRLTEEALRSAFLEMFGDPVTNPMGWGTQVLGTLLSFVTSGSRGWAKYYSESGSRFIRSLDVQMNYLSDEDIVYVEPPQSRESERTLVEVGDILLTITGSKIGRVAPVPLGIGKAHISQHVAILRLEEGLEPRFLSMFLSLPRGGQYQIGKMQYGQTKPGLNLDQIRSFQIPVPPLEKQQRFLEFWDKHSIYTQDQKMTRSLQETLFNALVQAAFRGELTADKAEEVQGQLGLF